MGKSKGLVGKIQNAFNKAAEVPSGSNRGDRMAARGKKKIARVEGNLEKRIVKKYEKPLAKQEKLKEKFGPKPTMGQANRIKKAVPTSTARENYGRLKIEGGLGIKDPRIKDESHYGKSYFPIANKQDRISVAKYKVKKGEMLSENIKYRRSQKKG